MYICLSKAKEARIGGILSQCTGEMTIISDAPLMPPHAIHEPFSQTGTGQRRLRYPVNHSNCGGGVLDLAARACCGSRPVKLLASHVVRRVAAGLEYFFGWVAFRRWVGGHGHHRPRWVRPEPPALRLLPLASPTPKGPVAETVE